MAITKFEIVGNPTNILPFNTLNGVITAFDVNTGLFTLDPNLNYHTNGVNVLEFQYNKLCDNVLIGTANVFLNITPPIGTLVITNDIGGSPNLQPVCGTTQIYKAGLSFTPNVAVAPLVYLWSIPVGFTIVSGQGTDTLTITVNSSFSGSGNLDLQVTTPFEVLNSSIILDAICATIIDHVYIVPINGIVNGDVSVGSTPCI